VNETIPPFAGRPPLILDFDGSVLPLGANETRIPLGAWQERMRFGCFQRHFSLLENHLRSLMPKEYGCVFVGSGDFHHLTLLLLRETAQRLCPLSPFDLVVCDNHPDNMRYPFGLHCGSWVSHAAALNCVRHVHVLGICSSDVTLAHAWENTLTPFLRRKLTCWTVNRRADWLGLAGRRDSCRVFPSADALIDAFFPVLEAISHAYISIDKDVLGPDIVRTNWDQGVFTEKHLEAILGAGRRKIVGVDLCGDISDYHYSSLLKQFLSRLDGQRPLSSAQIIEAQERHTVLNRKLLEWLQHRPCS